MIKEQKILGILGGMGTYAGLDFVQKFLREWKKNYKVEKENDYPRFILDNNCKLPSRVRAILYNEESPFEGMLRSIKSLKEHGADLVVIPCNTAHYYIPKLRESVDITIFSFVESLYHYLDLHNIKNIYVLASEGTKLMKIYNYNTDNKVIYAGNDRALRDVIEDVKMDRITNLTLSKFMRLLKKQKVNVLGCTEFSLLYNKFSSHLEDYNILDPEQIAINDIIKAIRDE